MGPEALPENDLGENEKCAHIRWRFFEGSRVSRRGETCGVRLLGNSQSTGPEYLLLAFGRLSRRQASLAC